MDTYLMESVMRDFVARIFGEEFNIEELRDWGI